MSKMSDKTEKTDTIQRKSIKKTLVVAAAAGLVVTTAWGTVEAVQTYTDSNVGISSAFDRYADSVAKEQTLKKEVSSETTTPQADGNSSEADSAKADKKKSDNAKTAKKTVTTETEASDKVSAETVAEPDETTETVKSEEAAEEDTAKTENAEQEDTENGTTEEVQLEDAYPEYENKCLAVAADYVNIRQEAGTDAEIVGILSRDGLATVEDKGDEWTKIVSGNCVGYISNEYLIYGDDIGNYAETYCDKQATVATETLYVRADADASSDCLTMVGQGQSFDILSQQDGWTQIAVDDTTTGYVSNDYIEYTYDFETAKTVSELEAEQAAEAAAAETSESAEEVQPEEVTETPTEETTEVSTEEVTEAPTEAVTEAPTETHTEAATEAPTEELTEAPTEAATEETTEESTEVPTETPTEAPTEAPTEEATEAPTEEVASSGQTGIDVANYAQQFVGNPYVYGGNSLTEGTDCSGFVMLVYAQFGYSLPHSAGMQADYGTRVDLSELEPGDILFYGDGSIGHCGIYIGDGLLVHASTPETGIKISNYNYRTPMCAVRLIGQ